MPFVQIDLLEGRDADRIASLMHDVTEAVASSLDVQADRVRVVVRDVPRTHWAVAGVSRAERG